MPVQAVPAKPGKASGGFFNIPSMSIDLAFNAVIWDERTVTGAPAPLGTNGTYNTRTYAGSLTAQINF